jgi:hypothetical protein
MWIQTNPTVLVLSDQPQAAATLCISSRRLGFKGIQEKMGLKIPLGLWVVARV